MSVYESFWNSYKENQKLLAVLLDPDKLLISRIPHLLSKIKNSPVTHILVGGSTVNQVNMDALIQSLKQYSTLPIILFPGEPSQLSGKADALLFLSLVSGRNPDYLIEHQVNAVPFLQKHNLEVIPTAYVLIDGGSLTAVQRVTQTQPLSVSNPNYIVQTALAGNYLGHKLVYLEAGSGAKHSVPLSVVQQVSESISVPLIVGGGIRNYASIQNVFKAGATMVVIGTAFENDDTFFDI